MNNKKGIFIIGVLVLILIGLLIYYQLNHKEEALILTPSYSITISEVDLDSIEKMIVPYHSALQTESNAPIDGMFRKNGRATVGNLSNSVKLYFIFKNILSNLELEKKYIMIYECEEESPCEQEITEDVCNLEEGCQILFYVSEVMVNEYANLFYGDSPSLVHESFLDKSLNLVCEYDNGYSCRQRYFEDPVNYQNYFRRIRYQEYQGEVTIYHQYLLHLDDQYYSSFDGKESISLPSDVITDSILEQYGTTYKSVFRKVDDHYIWIYSEPVV